MRFLSSMVFSVGFILTKAFVASMLFNWFVSNTFDLEPIGFIEMIGIVFLVNIFKLNIQELFDKVGSDKSVEDINTKKNSIKFSAILAMFAILGLSYLVTLFI